MLVYLCPDGVPGCQRMYEAVDHFLLSKLWLECAEHAVPDYEHTSWGGGGPSG